MDIFISPHPPIVIETIGGKDRLKAKATIKGLQEIAREIERLQPDTIIYVTPHGNAFQDATCIYTDQEIEGNFSKFGHHELRNHKFVNQSLSFDILKAIQDEGFKVVSMDQTLAKGYNIFSGLDHGVLVPMWFIDDLYSTYDMVHITPGFTELAENYRIGQVIDRCIGKYEKETNQKVVLLLSGDLSHALKSDGPYEFHPQGPVFDGLIQEAINRLSPEAILDLSPEFVDQACQCGLRPILIGLGAMVNYQDRSSGIYSYEGPYGVGYLTGYMHSQEVEKPDVDILVDLARRTINTYIRHNRAISKEWYIGCLEEENSPLLRQVDEINQLPASATFVSLHAYDKLRGCIGSLVPVREHVFDEVIHNAISACSKDPRFNPVAVEELKNLDIKVDVLYPLEPIEDMDELDVKLYGIVVEQGMKRGVLLPNLEGIETVEEQMNIAIQKAGISSGNINLYRFKVQRHQNN